MGNGVEECVHGRPGQWGDSGEENRLLEQGGVRGGRNARKVVELVYFTQCSD